MNFDKMIKNYFDYKNIPFLLHLIVKNHIEIVTNKIYFDKTRKTFLSSKNISQSLFKGLF